MRAPGIEFTGPDRRPGPTDALRADIAGFAGIFEHGPVLVSRRVEDWGELRAIYGGFVPIPGAPGRQALSPLALHGFFQNGGTTCIVHRLASPRMRAAKAPLIDPATGRAIGLVASSPGAWANGVRLRIPLTVLRRVVAPSGFPLDHGLPAGSLVRVTDREHNVVFGLLEGFAGRVGLLSRRRLVPPLVVEQIDTTVDVTIEGAGAANRRERFRNLSLLPNDRRYPYLFDFLAVAKPRPPVWTPAIPSAWQPIDCELELALGQQGPAASMLLRSIVLPAPDAEGYEACDPFWGALPGCPSGAKGSEIVVELTGGADALAEIDEAAFLSAFNVLARSPEPSIVCVPELMLPLAPLEAGSDDAQKLPPLDPEPAPAPPPRPWERALAAKPRRAPIMLQGLPAAEIPSEMPRYGASIPMLQEELLAALAGSVEGRERIALLDPLPAEPPLEVAERAGRFADVLAERGGALVRASGLGTMLYPWIRVLDPRTPGQRRVLIPPSGHVAGILASVTRSRGPAAPFGDTSILGAVASARDLSESERADLNALGVSAIRVLARQGVVVYGERTVSRGADADRHVPGARVLAFLRRRLRVVGETLVFEPNTEQLRLRVCLLLEGVLRELFMQGVFAGATAVESYAVRCDEARNPPEAVALGQLIAEIDVAIAVPLEFLTIRVAFSRDGAAVLDGVLTKEAL
ncbi:hypothetical protein [Sorangium sp. So ce117]|uniref:hypothetical protein n=1 Tax=Sorangium sp. So ce117 TaxID=3133277 RepID=UPI003F5E0C82